MVIEGMHQPHEGRTGCNPLPSGVVNLRFWIGQPKDRDGGAMKMRLHTFTQASLTMPANTLRKKIPTGPTKVPGSVFALFLWQGQRGD